MFYVHFADPHFDTDDPPKDVPNGVRRLGPFLTLEEAVAQAESDAAHGAGVALGVYDEDDQVVGQDEIAELGRAEAERRLAHEAHMQATRADRDATLNELLARPNVTAQDLRDAGMLL